MNYVRSNRDRQVASDRSWLGFLRIRRPNDLPKSLYRVWGFEDHENNWARCDMVDQFLEERFSFVDAVECLRLFLGDVMQFQLFEDEALAL